jgi:hypothetical protein
VNSYLDPGLLRRFGVLVVAVLMAMSALTLLTQASASAATTCSGALIDTVPIRVSGQAKTGDLKLYYDSATGGTNCAIATNNTGIRYHMELEITRCADVADPCSSLDERIQGKTLDIGEYASYAGPVTVKHAAGYCLYVGVYMEKGSNPDNWPDGVIRGHCG